MARNGISTGLWGPMNASLIIGEDANFSSCPWAYSGLVILIH